MLVSRQHCFQPQGRDLASFNSEIFSAVEMNAMLDARTAIKSYCPGQTILAQGEKPNDIMIVIEGWVICQKFLEDGSRQILDLLLPGSILGFQVSENAPYGVEAKTDCRVAILPRAAFHRLLMKSPALCLKCVEYFAHDELRVLERLSHIGRRSAKERVAGFVVEIALRFKSVKGTCNQNTFELPLTQIDMADMLGLAHETVCRVLVAMRDAKLTTWRNNKLQIHDLEGLMDIAGVEPAAMTTFVEAGAVKQLAA
jgi:CRP/FNR family transcriptional regulator, anaerobic regulatory protein